MRTASARCGGGRQRTGAPAARLALVALAGIGASCSFDPGHRWEYGSGGAPAAPPICEPGELRCAADVLERCVEMGSSGSWTTADDCAAAGLVCAAALEACALCQPGESFCDGQQASLCSTDGSSKSVVEVCDTSVGRACRGRGCVHLCTQAAAERSNVGCEYWAVDLDNAMISASKNAAAQQFAVVVSNPQPDVAVAVTITQDDAEPGEPAELRDAAQAVVAPLNLRVFKLGPREVDGSPAGEYDTGTHSALSRHAYRVRADFPVVVYQFNPLENVNVFSNDASLLKPREALTYDTMEPSLAYVVAGWPQTIAATDDPNTNFNPANPIHLRAFLTIVGTLPGTRVRVEPTTRIVGGGAVPETAPGEALEAVLEPFEVLNLETADFNADFTGTRVLADGPVAVFSGGEASDAPSFETLAERRCCADHLEEQLDPIRTAGRRFVLVHSPSRTSAVVTAGALIGIAAEPEYVRFVATREGVTSVTTTLGAPHAELTLDGIGDWHEVEVTRDFMAEASAPIHVVQVSASQDAANVPRGLPGGDPSLLVVPPREQFRSDYVFLTPDKYAFDFVMIAAPAGAEVRLDEELLEDYGCEVAAADGLSPEERGSPTPELLAYRCQLSFPQLEQATGALLPGIQRDGVHRIVATEPVGVTVFGFDSYVSYAYAAGTELREIAPPR